MASKKDNPLIGSFRAPVPDAPPPAGPAEGQKPAEPPKATPDPKATGTASVGFWPSPALAGVVLVALGSGAALGGSAGFWQDQAGLRFVKLADIKPLSGTYVKDTPRKDYTELIDSIKKSGGGGAGGLGVRRGLERLG